ncbi:MULTISPECIES: hypothetical protein [Butyricimonas]|uniref:hypothetical protein n=1 Tax=Butyricimonas TaxID=574697 RepID=UPI001D0961DC|nr:MULTISPECIES: hypothetical protein [Butyricimonas]MCB6972104.1 hypothetical protein [Butyricimonas synergistica]MCG4519333.1 hypothetical protein [Butyricimonas sp. DFI.6.44]
MKTFILLIAVLTGIVIVSCHDITVGYLSTENASYDPDTLEVKKVLDIDSVQNPKWTTYWGLAQSMYMVFGYSSPEECMREMFSDVQQWEYSADYERKKLEIPWLSTKIQGVTGTQQIYVQIKDIKSPDGGDVKAMAELLSVRGDGMFKLPLDVSSIPAGRYVISLNFENEGYSKDVDDVFTIIVK